MTSERSENRSTRSDRWLWLLRCIASGAGVSIVGSLLVAFCIQINYLLSATPWFLIPVAIAICIAMSKMRCPDSPIESQLLSMPAAWMSTIVGILLGVIAAALTGLNNVSSGNVVLPGDKYQATLVFQMSATLVTIVAAGIYEELGMRGYIQFRLARHWQPHICEAIAGLVFVALHYLRFQATGQLLFVCLLTLVCGRAAAMTKTALWPTCIHVGANVTVMTLVWLGRY